MSSFLKTSYIHDETAPSESLVLHLKRSFSRQHHLHFFLVFLHRQFRKRWRRPQILQFCGDDRHIRQEPRTCILPYTSVVPAKMQDLRPSPSFTKSSIPRPSSTHRLFCAWPPPEADRDCRQRAGGAMPDPAHAPGRFAKGGQARLRSISAASTADLPGFEQWQSCDSRTLALDPKFEINFLFCRKCAICDFPSGN